MSTPTTTGATDSTDSAAEKEAVATKERSSSLQVDAARVLGDVRVLVAAAIVLSLVACVVTWLAVSARSEDRRSAEARKEVGTSLVSLLSWRSATVSDELASEKKLLTGDFATEYERLVEQTIAPAASETKLDSEAEIVQSGVVTIEDDKAVLLYFVNVTVSGPGQPEDTVGSRIKATAVARDGHWLIQEYDPI